MLGTVYTPHAVADRCYLWEALLCISVGRIPLLEVSEDFRDAREHKEYIEGVVPERHLLELIYEEESSRAGLETDPAYENLMRDYPYFSINFYKGL